MTAIDIVVDGAGAGGGAEWEEVIPECEELGEVTSALVVSEGLGWITVVFGAIVGNGVVLLAIESMSWEGVDTGAGADNISSNGEIACDAPVGIELERSLALSIAVDAD
jgi:hypothetical protein